VFSRSNTLVFEKFAARYEIFEMIIVYCISNNVYQKSEEFTLKESLYISALLHLNVDIVGILGC